MTKQVLSKNSIDSLGLNYIKSVFIFLLRGL